MQRLAHHNSGTTVHSDDNRGLSDEEAASSCSRGPALPYQRA